MKKFKFLLVIAICLLLNVIIVNASTDFSNVKIDIKYNETSAVEENRVNAYLVFSGITLDEEKEYRVVYTKDTDSVVDSFSDKPELSSLLYNEDGIIREGRYASASERFGDVYVTIYESENTISPYKKVSDSILIKRPEELKLTKRIQAYLFNNETSFFLYSINHVDTKRKVNYKIGEVTDRTILRKINNNQYSGFKELLSYAKNDDAPIISGKIDLKSGIESPLYSQSDVTEGTYYYGYFSLDTEDGKYYPVEDVDLYYASTVDEKVWLYNHTDSHFKWNLGDETSEEEEEEDEKIPEKNPKTGIQDYNVLIGLIIVVASGILVYIYKDKTFRKM